MTRILLAIGMTALLLGTPLSVRAEDTPAPAAQGAGVAPVEPGCMPGGGCCGGSSACPAAKRDATGQSGGCPCQKAKAAAAAAAAKPKSE